MKNIKNKKRRKRLENFGFLIMLISIFGLMMQLCINIFFMSKPSFVKAQPIKIEEQIEEKENGKVKIENESETILKKEIITEGEDNLEKQNEMQTLPKEENVENESDLYWLSHLIMAEEEGASYENKLMCGLVAMNRVKDKSFPNTLEEVIFQKDKKENVQYACIKSINGKKARIYLEPNEDSMQAAKEILSENCSVTIPENVVYQAEYPLGSGVYKKIGNQIYSYK